MSQKVPASSGRRQATGGRAGRSPGREKIVGTTNNKNRTAPGMPGEARPYPGHPDDERDPGGHFFGKGGKP